MWIGFLIILILKTLNLLGTNVINGEEVAIKVESEKAKHPQLEYEARVYKSLAGGGKLSTCHLLLCLSCPP